MIRKIKKNKITKTAQKTVQNLFSILVILFAARVVHAGGCHLEEVSPSKVLASEHMADEIRNEVLELEKKMKAKGQELKVVMIARSGESLASFDIIADDLTKPLQPYLDFISDGVAANTCLYDRGIKKRPSAIKTCNKNQPPVLPKEFISKEKLLYSHVGFFMKRNYVAEKNLTPQEKALVPDWIYIAHLLAECDESTDRYGSSKIFYEKLNRFFWDTKILSNNSSARRAMIVVPTASMQENLFKIIHDKSIASGLHEPKYNVASVPFVLRGRNERHSPAPAIYQLKDQNSNQWPLEMLAAATRPAGEVRSRMQAQDILFSLNFHPSILWPKGLKESSACDFARGPFGAWDATNLIRCDDQIFRGLNLFQLITVKSLTNFLGKSNLLLVEADGFLPTGRVVTSGMAEIELLKSKIDELDRQGKASERLAEAIAAAAKAAEKKDQEIEKAKNRPPRDA